MKMNKAVVVLCLLLTMAGQSIRCQGNAPAKDSSVSGGASFKGLTGTLASLLSSKPGSYVAIGSRQYLLETLVDDDISRNFNCDSAIKEYMDRDGELNYETLADIMETQIRQGFDGDDGSLNVTVDASEEENVMSFSIYAYRDRPVTLPIALTSKDGAFLASCRAQCVVKFEFYAELKVDSVLVTRDELAKGIKLDISEYTLQLLSRSEDSGEPFIEGNFEVSNPVPAKAEFKYRDASIETDTARFDIDYSWKWYLQSPGQDASDEDSESNFLSYETIFTCGYTWDFLGGGQMGLWSSARAEADDEPPEGSGLAFDYTADEHGPEREERLHIFDGEWLRLELPADNAIDRSVGSS